MDTITIDEALALHEAALEAYGGAAGLRDRGLLESALAQPLATFGGRPLYTTLWDKVAALGRSLICNHAFADGNKRVGFAAMAIVLLRNGYELTCSVDGGEAAIQAVASGELAREGLAEWLEAYSCPVDQAPN